MAITYVRPEGDPSKALIAIVGEQPDKTAIQTGIPFSGPAGRVLDECLRTLKISRSDCYITNVIKDLDHPLDYYISYGKDITFSKDGLFQLNNLIDELNHTSAKAIICLGWVPLYALLERTEISKWRGSILQSDKLPRKWIIPTYHPATTLPSYGKGEYKGGEYKGGEYLNKLLIQYDIKKAIKIISEKDFKKVERNLIIQPSFNQVLEFLLRMKQEGLGGKVVCFDIELMNEEISCISFGTHHQEIMSIPFIDHQGPYFTMEQEKQVWQSIASILEHPEISKCGQNVIFDSHLLLRKYGIKTTNLHDTMVAQKTLLPDYPVGLDFISSIWTDQEYYKDEGKKYFSGGNWPRLWKYNATDSSICAEVLPKQLKELKKYNNMDTYNRQRKMIEPLYYMMERGIKINVEKMTKAYNKAGETIEQLKKELSQLVGYELNSNSPKQLINHFYIIKKAPEYKSKGRVTTDETAMVRLARKGFKEATKILEIRRMVRKKSTYLDPAKVDPDGRMRCAYNPVGTRYSRISSSRNIFGTGGNLQNQPHDVLELFEADEGYLYFGMDLSQAENRIVAQIGNIPQMILAFETGDVHSLTASLISGLPVEEVIRQDKENIPCHLGDGTKTWRFYGKKANHGLNYGLGYKKFALHLEIPETDAKYIVDRYHLAYPGVRQNYHAIIKKQLSENRTITNLMGRKTIFTDEWGDEMFKEAYSCIPQGTVGDVINERGVEYIYYNQNLFSPIELLTQVHDSIGFQIPLNVGLDKIVEMLSMIKSSLETPLVLPNGKKFIIPVDISIGFNMFDKHCKKISSKETLDYNKLAPIYAKLVEEKNERQNAIKLD